MDEGCEYRDHVHWPIFHKFDDIIVESIECENCDPKHKSEFMKEFEKSLKKKDYTHVFLDPLFITKAFR